MNDPTLTEKQIKKREANKKYREKLTQEQNTEEPPQRTQEPEPKTQEPEQRTQEPEQRTEEPGTEEEEDQGTETEETFVLDKKTYLYLLEKAKKNETVEIEKTQPQEKKPEPPINNGPSFFQLVGANFKTTAISLIPILTIQVLMHGGKLLTNSTRNIQSKGTSQQQNNMGYPSMQDYALPSVNSL